MEFVFRARELMHLQSFALLVTKLKRLHIEFHLKWTDDAMQVSLITNTKIDLCIVSRPYLREPN